MAKWVRAAALAAGIAHVVACGAAEHPETEETNLGSVAPGERPDRNAGSPERGDAFEDAIPTRVSAGSLENTGGTGAFDHNQVTAMLRQRQDAFLRCYEDELAHDPRLAGRMAVRFTIEPQGHLTNAHTADDTTGSQNLAACVTGLIQRLRWRHGPTGGSVSYSYPLTFTP